MQKQNTLHFSKIGRVVRSIILLSSCFLLFPLLSNADEIPFESGTLQNALDKANKENKMVFVDAYTSWCGPCKWMAKNVFTNEEVIKFYARNFVCIKIDMEAGEGRTIAKLYNVHAYPTFMFLDASGVKIHQTCGSKEANDFITDGKNALNPEKQLIQFEKKYNSGVHEFDFLYQYAHVLLDANMDGKEVVSLMVEKFPSNELINETDFEFLSQFAELQNSPFAFIVNHKEKYEALVGKKKMDEFITEVFLTEAVNAAKLGLPERFENAKKQIDKYGIENSGELMANMDWRYAQRTKKGLFEAAKPYIEGFKMNDANELNNAAWTIFENYKESDKLEVATNWAKQAVAIKKDFANTDTYANLLFKIGKNDQALETAKTSIALAKEENEDSSDTEKLLKEITAAKAAKK